MQAKSLRRLHNNDAKKHQVDTRHRLRAPLGIVLGSHLCWYLKPTAADHKRAYVSPENNNAAFVGLQATRNCAAALLPVVSLDIVAEAQCKRLCAHPLFASSALSRGNHGDSTCNTARSANLTITLRSYTRTAQDWERRALFNRKQRDLSNFVLLPSAPPRLH